MDALDGNALAGLLEDIFGAELTTAAGVCGHCGAHAVVAECEVYVGGPGAVARCRTCKGVLLIIVQRHELHCVDLRGLASLDPA